MTTSIESLTHTVIELTPEIADAIGLVGKIVTFSNQQWTVHAIEGHDWYTFNRNGIVVTDMGMTPSHYITDPVATLIPTGHKIGDGHSQTAHLSSVKRGVCLSKGW